MAAARTGRVDVLRLLLAHGADVGAREDWRGQTALHWAAAENHAPAVHALVELGADIDARSNAGWSALLFAVRAGQQEAVRALLEAGADPNDVIRPPAAGNEGRDAGRRDPTVGTSALVIAVMNAHFSLAQHLVRQGADPNAAQQGWTALHQLAYTRRPNSGKGMPPVEMVDPVDTLAFARFLLEHGADPNLQQTARFSQPGGRPRLHGAPRRRFAGGEPDRDVPGRAGRRPARGERRGVDAAAGRRRRALYRHGQAGRPYGSGVSLK